MAAGDNPERLTAEVSFAALCGVSPVERLWRRTQRRRRDCGGNRQANAVLFHIALTRLGADPRTRAYVEKRTSEGRTKRDILRYVKRYVACEIFKTIKVSYFCRWA
ncbi:transposase [Micromonospora sp. NPDC020750]|uniref:transposase n=1 Tax=unclassified Micromonospora TaxID=2617518 RepID=UPI00379134F5